MNTLTIAPEQAHNRETDEQAETSTQRELRQAEARLTEARRGRSGLSRKRWNIVTREQNDDTTRRKKMLDVKRDEAERQEYEQARMRHEHEELQAINRMLEERVHCYERAFQILKIAGILSEEKFRQALDIAGWNHGREAREQTE